MHPSFPDHYKLAIDRIVKGSFDDYSKAKNTGLPRLAVLATTSEKEHLVNSVAGFERNDTQSPLSDESTFPLWSATKLFTVIAALQLVEKGVIRVEEEASKYVDELKGLKVLKGFTDDDEPVYEDAETECTIEMLMLHTAGFSFSYNPLVSKMEKMSGLPWLYADNGVRESLTSTSYVFQPGTAFAYGSSTDWLALVVAEASGIPFDEYLQKNLFDPLDITDMTFQNCPSRVDMATIPPPPSDDSPLPPYSFSDMKFPTSIAWGGAGLSGSPKSYLKVLRSLLLGGTCASALNTTDSQRRILRPETVDLLFRPRFDSSNKDDPIMKSYLPFVEERSDPWSHRTGKQFEGVNFAYGGLTSGEGFPSGRSRGALAWSGAASTFWVVDREKDVAFIVWSCIVPHSHENFMSVWEEVEPLLYKGLDEMRR
ncbi:serine hydrolase domain-containing protein [Sporobolomyces salmoneus]|uniref:serine hydrolase domain-containing protein n=1 Tax=Sporobolomyces salmoneus TaxID=183962 RepID=UPI00317C37E5